MCPFTNLFIPMDVKIIHKALLRLGDHLTKHANRDGYNDYIVFNEDISGEFQPDCILRIAEETTGEMYASYNFNEDTFVETFHSDYNKFAKAFNNKYCTEENKYIAGEVMTKLPILGDAAWKRMFHEVYKKQEIKIDDNLLLLI